MSLRKYAKYAVKKYPAVRKRYRVYTPAVKQLATDVMYLKGLINSEPHFNVVQSSGNFAWNGSVISCCNVANGDRDTERTGNRILPRYFNLRLHVNQGVTAGFATHTTHRVIVFRYWGDSGNTTGSCIPSEVLEITGTQFSPMSPLNANMVGSRGDRSRRIEVLRNEMFTLDQVGRTCYDIEYNIEMNKGGKKNKEHIEFTGAGAIEPASGGIFVLLINDNSVGTQQSYYMVSKLTFYDN